MNKGRIVQIILYAILIIILLAIMTCILFKRDFIFTFDEYEKIELFNENYSLEEVDKLTANLVSTDITIKYSEDDNIKIIVYGKEKNKDRYSITNEDKNLKVNEKAYTSFCFGFCFYNEEIVIYLPESFNKDINIKGTSSEVNIMNNYDSNLEIQTVSGDIEVHDVNDIVAKSTSGDISIDNANNVEAKSTSGEVSIKSCKLAKVETVSGDISIDEAEEININSTSGEVVIGKSGNINISTTSGDILVNELIVNVESIIGTASGDVQINKVNDVFVESKTTSGDIRLENNNRMSENTLKIKTISGDIVVR